MLKSTPKHYGAVAVAIHWISALCIMILLASGFFMGAATHSADKLAALWVHIPVGIITLILTVSRILWWVMVDTKPKSEASQPVWQKRLAAWVHKGFYVVIFGMVASGIGMLVLSGATKILLSGASTTLPDFSAYAPSIPHGIGARLFLLLLVIHIGAALYHYFIKRDGLLKRIWFTPKSAK